MNAAESLGRREGGKEGEGDEVSHHELGSSDLRTGRFGAPIDAEDDDDDGGDDDPV